MRTTPLGVCATAALLRNTPTQNRPIKGEYRIDASLKAVQNMACFAVSVTEPIAKSECHRLDRQVSGPRHSRFSQITLHQSSRTQTSSGSGFPFVSGRKGAATNPRKEMQAKIIEALP